jgi:hypothetical protein
MATAASQVLPIALTGEYRADGAFRALGRDLTTAKAGASSAKQEMVSLSSAADKLSGTFVRAGQNVQFIGKQAGSSAYLFQGLGFQINDIATGLAMGQSPFQILAQQGGQVYQVLSMQEGGVGGALKTVKEKILEIATPGRVVVAGFAAAAGAAYLLYRAINSNAPTAEQALDEQGRLLGIVKTAYSDAAKAAGEFYDQSKNIVTLQAQQNILALQNQLRSQTGSAIKTMTTPTSLPSEIPLPPGTQAIENASVGATAFRALNSAIEDFNASTQDAASVTAFRDLVGAIGAAAAATNPELAKTAFELLNNTKAMGDMAMATLKAEAALRLLTGTATEQDRKLLGLSVKVSVNAYAQLIQRTKDRIAELKEEEAQAGKTGNAILAMKLQHEAERAAKQAGVKVNQVQLDQLKEELVLRTNLKAAAEMRSDINFEREQLGRSPGEAEIAERLRSAKIDASSAQGQFLAGQIRVNQSLTETRDLSREALKGFINDMRSGKSAGEAFAGVLEKIASKLVDMAVNDLVGNAFKGAGSAGGGGGGGLGLLSGIGKLFGFANGGEFRVGGQGGTDSQLVAFKASPDETVRITKPGQGGPAGRQVVIQATNYFSGDIKTSDRTWIETLVAAANSQLASQVTSIVAGDLQRDRGALGVPL